MQNHFAIRFIENYSGKKLAIVTTGGGVGLGTLIGVPGASRVFHSFYCPYDTAASIEFIKGPTEPCSADAFTAKAVSLGGCHELLMAQIMATPSNTLRIAVTAALTSNRYRRGDNHAYIGFINENSEEEIWHLMLPKLPEEEYNNLTPYTLLEQRQREDDFLSMMVLKLACNFEADEMKGTLISNGTLTRIHP